MVYRCSGILFRLLKEWRSDTSYNMDEPWKHYAKWNKPAMKGQLSWSLWYEVARIITFIDTESRMVVARRTESSCLMGSVFPFGRIERVLEMDGGGGYTTMWTCLMLQSCTLKNSLKDKSYV